MDKIFSREGTLYVEANDSNVCVSFFDSKGCFISGETVLAGTTLEVPVEGAYYRIDQTLPLPFPVDPTIGIYHVIEEV